MLQPAFRTPYNACSGSDVYWASLCLSLSHLFLHWISTKVLAPPLSVILNRNCTSWAVIRRVTNILIINLFQHVFRQKIRAKSIVPLFYGANLETSEQCSYCNLTVIEIAVTCILRNTERAVLTILEELKKKRQLLNYVEKITRFKSVKRQTETDYIPARFHNCIFCDLCNKCNWIC